jgi:hypothetical protein
MDFFRCFCDSFLSSFFSFNESLIIIFSLSSFFSIFFAFEATWYRGLMGQLQAYTFGFYLVCLPSTSAIERAVWLGNWQSDK